MRISAVPLLLSFAAVGSGFWLGRGAARMPEEGPVATPGEAALVRPSPETATSAAEPAVPRAGADAAARLEALVGAPSSLRRSLELQLAVLTMDAASVQDLWKRLRPTLQLALPEDRELALALLQRLAELDPDAALEVTFALGARAEELLPDVLAAWSRVDREGALAWLAGAETGLRAKALAAVLEDLGGRDRQAALDVFREAVADGTAAAGSWDTTEFFRAWAKEDPQAAANEALALQELTRRDTALSSALMTWARDDPDAALEWLTQHTEKGGRQNHLFLSLVDGWAEAEPARAAEFAMGIEHEWTASRALSLALINWMPTGFADAASWIEGLDDPRVQQVAEYKLVYYSRLHGNPDEGLAHAIRRYDANPGMFHAIFLHSSRIIEKDPVQAIDWVRNTIPAPRMREELFNEILATMKGALDHATRAQYLDIAPDPIRRASMYEGHGRRWAALGGDGRCGGGARVGRFAAALAGARQRLAGDGTELGGERPGRRQGLDGDAAAGFSPR